MTYRMTVVLEYATDRDAPQIGPDTRDFGTFKVAAVQFSDALRELEVLAENASEEDKLRAYQAATSSSPSISGEPT
jgi:hypothetical protein